MQVEIKSLNIKPQLAHGCRSGSRRCSRRCSHWPRALGGAAAAALDAGAAQLAERLPNSAVG